MKKNRLYGSHSAFANLASPLPLPQKLVDEFNSYYTLISERGKFLGNNEQSNIYSKLQILLKQIFEELKLSVKNQDETLKLFLTELYFHAEQLLMRDLQENFLSPVNQLHINNVNVSTPEYHNLASKMLNNRYFRGVISDKALQKLQTVAEPALRKFREQVNIQGKTNREDLSDNRGEIVSQLVKIINDEFEQQRVNEAVSIYCSRPMTSSGLGIELSVPVAQWWKNDYTGYDNIKTLYMHTDEALSIPKAIVYLTDVSEENGPFSIVPNALESLSPSPIQFLLGRIIGCVGRNKNSLLYDYYEHQYHKTFGCPKYRKHFMSLPQELQYNSHFGWDIIPGSSLEEELINKEIICTGQAGEYIVFDGARLVHRGGLVQVGERLALQVCFIPITVPTIKSRIVSKVKSTLKRLINKQ
jgi:hypothetical protein